jgi:stearoyl-CoA desaturase (delta-9 desaturase)
MFNSLLTFLSGGVFHFSLLQQVLLALVLVQITIASVTIYLHRHQAHRGLDLHPVAGHFFRFWLWLTTGMVTKEWVAVHRKHHAKCETEEDPHSPMVYGIGKLLFDGVDLYRTEATNDETLARYGHGTPDDWLERRVYARHKYLGIVLMLLINLAVFGAAGLAVWAVQMMWIPFWAAGVINGLGHWWGYRNYETQDTSTNLAPLALWIGGEELHNNHHAFPSSAKFSTKWWELDIGWLYIRLLSVLGLARVKKVAPRPQIAADKQRIDLDTLRAVISARFHVTANYARQVIRPVLKEAVAQGGGCRHTFRKAKALLVRDRRRMDAEAREELESVLRVDSRLQVVYSFRLRLQEVWERAATSHDTLVHALKDWCAQAEASGIRSLQEFARTLRGFSLKETAS